MSVRSLRFAAAAAATVGIGVTAYLLNVRWGGGEMLCRTGGCETVQSSDYAVLLGVPVAALGLAAYGAIAALMLLGSRLALAAAVSIALAGLAFSAYLLVVQLAVIDEICDWCVVNDAVISVVAVLVVFGAYVSMRPASRA